MKDKLNFTGNTVWRGSGLKLAYYSRALSVHSLNPEKNIKETVSRWEMFRLGLWFIRRAFA
jgi:hypothetical protein